MWNKLGTNASQENLISCKNTSPKPAIDPRYSHAKHSSFDIPHKRFPFLPSLPYTHLTTCKNACTNLHGAISTIKLSVYQSSKSPFSTPPHHRLSQTQFRGGPDNNTKELFELFASCATNIIRKSFGGTLFNFHKKDDLFLSTIYTTLFRVR